MKQQCTERGREVLNHALDIHGGAGICIGYSNFLEKFYRAAPIGITVEGSNTLTRSLIIFGQGLNKSHPFIFPILDSVLEDDLQKFKNNFSNIIKHSLKLYFKSFYPSNTLEQQIINYACLTNFVALKGGKLKREQMLSGDMADILSNLYLALSVQYYEQNYPTSQKLSQYIINNLINQNQEKMNKIIENLGGQKFILFHLKRKVNYTKYEQEREIFEEIMNNPKIISEIKKNIHIQNTILQDMEDALKLHPQNPKYSELKDKIINVGEYQN